MVGPVLVVWPMPPEKVLKQCLTRWPRQIVACAGKKRREAVCSGHMFCWPRTSLEEFRLGVYTCKGSGLVWRDGAPSLRTCTNARSESRPSDRRANTPHGSMRAEPNRFVHQLPATFLPHRIIALAGRYGDLAHGRGARVTHQVAAGIARNAGAGDGGVDGAGGGLAGSASGRATRVTGGSRNVASNRGLRACSAQQAEGRHDSSNSRGRSLGAPVVRCGCMAAQK